MIAKTPKSRYADHLKEWEDFSTSLLPSATEAPQIEIQRAALQKMLELATARWQWLIPRLYG